jgi:hypothetical protein
LIKRLAKRDDFLHAFASEDLAPNSSKEREKKKERERKRYAELKSRIVAECFLAKLE